jgi:glycosyltransferase involved in cell wall biosynthesis
VKVVVAVHGRFHGFDLARQLYVRNALARLMTTYPAFVARRMLPQGIALDTAPWLEAKRRIADKLRFLPRPDIAIGRSFGRFAAANMPVAADLFVGWSGACLEAVPVARQRGMRVVIERGSSHIAHQARVLADSYAEFGVTGRAVDKRMMERELAEYAAADLIAVPTRFAADTFVAHGVARHKLTVNPYGADLSRFIGDKPHLKRAGRIQILFVGQVGIRKGVPWLLAALDRLGSAFELHLVGPIEGYIRHLIPRSGANRIIFHGPLRSQRLDLAFRTADIFCLPSLEEGLPLSLLQAMAAGLPIVATPETGAGDIIQDGVEGLIVPSRDTNALVAAFEGLTSEDRRRSMGTAARERVGRGLTWQDYGDRTVSAYRQLIG